jgi:hypothetical protein
MSVKNYWCYRINKDEIVFFKKELFSGRLRQGWGYDIGQNLKNLTVDEGAGRNRSMFNYVKKGDILLVPHLPEFDSVAIVEATEDWDIGYKYEIDPVLGEYGHIFPAKYIKKFSRNNEKVTGNLRSTLKNLSRFWNINNYSKDVEILLNANETELSKTQDDHNRLESSITDVFNEVFKEKDFTEKLYEKLTKQFQSSEWENAIVYGLRIMFPFYFVERVGGKEEKNHGTDILIKIPGILGNFEYAIAIQVKDYEGFVENNVIDQINKSKDYYEREGLKIIDKIVIITKAKKDENLKLIKYDKSVKLIFSHQLKELFTGIGKNYIGIKSIL